MGEPDLDVCCQIRHESSHVLSICLSIFGGLVYFLALGCLLPKHWQHNKPRVSAARFWCFLCVHFAFQVLWGLQEALSLSGASNSRRERSYDVDAKCWNDCRSGNATWVGCAGARWPFEDPKTIPASHGSPGVSAGSMQCGLPVAPWNEALAFLAVLLIANWLFGQVFWAYWQLCREQTNGCQQVLIGVVLPNSTCPAPCVTPCALRGHLIAGDSFSESSYGDAHDWKAPGKLRHSAV